MHKNKKTVANDWLLKTISECSSDEPYSTQIGPFGKALMAHEYTSHGVAVLRGVNVNYGRFYDDDFVFISEEKADQLKKFESYPDDVLLVHKGTIGPIGIMPHKRKYSRYILGNSMMRVKCDLKKLLPKYLYYWLSSREGQDYLYNRISQVGVPQLQTPLTTLREAALSVPNIPQQKTIVSILDALDDKIDNLQKINLSLEKIIQSIFKSWFVDFDGQTEFVDSELGKIPKGWEVKELPEVTEIVDCLHIIKPKEIETGAYLLQLFNIVDFGLIDLSKKFHVSNKDYTLWTKNIEVKEGDCIISNAGRVGAIAQIPYWLKGGIGRNLTAIRPIQISPTYLVEYLFSKIGQLEIEKQTDSATVFNTLNVRGIIKIRILIPDENTINRYEIIARPLRKTIEINFVTNSNLTKIRDALLPKLMSGEIKVD